MAKKKQKQPERFEERDRPDGTPAMTVGDVDIYVTWDSNSRHAEMEMSAEVDDDGRVCLFSHPLPDELQKRGWVVVDRTAMIS